MDLIVYHNDELKHQNIYLPLWLPDSNKAKREKEKERKKFRRKPNRQIALSKIGEMTSYDFMKYAYWKRSYIDMIEDRHANTSVHISLCSDSLETLNRIWTVILYSTFIISILVEY